MDSDDVRREWADRSGEYSPQYYADYGPNKASEAVLERLDRHVDRDARILELGCSSGRHLAHLLDHGYDDLTGVELNDEAFEVMAEHYPDLAETGTFHVDAIENVVTEFEDDAFDAVYSVETLQHLHPDVEWVFDELPRITRDVLITVENEGDLEETEAEETRTRHGVNYVNDEFPLYYRDWNAIFTERGLTEVDAEQGDRDTIRTFRSR